MTAKRGQAGGAAALVAIIATILVLYIILLPADIREELLNDSTTKKVKEAEDKEESLLVFEHPGTLDPLQLRDREKILDSFNLYSEKSAVVLKSSASAQIENAWFTKRTHNLSFTVDDLANTENYVLAFDVASSRGRLIIELNGKEIYNTQVSVGNVPPIKIDKDDVREENSLIFTSSGVGLAFWRVNEYNLRNVRVIADFTDVSKKEYTNFFIVSATEKENIEEVELSFIPYCLTDKVGPLTIKMNGRLLPYQAIPDCGLLSRIPFDPNNLKQGENIITFRADEGNYLIDRVKIISKLQPLDYPFYYFELEKEDFEAIEDGEANITIELRFADFDDKTGELNVDGHITSIDTDEIRYEKDISLFVEEGQNFIQIKPRTNPLNIVDLRIILVK